MGSAGVEGQLGTPPVLIRSFNTCEADSRHMRRIPEYGYLGSRAGTACKARLRTRYRWSCCRDRILHGRDPETRSCDSAALVRDYCGTVLRSSARAVRQQALTWEWCKWVGIQSSCGGGNGLLQWPVNGVMQG